MYTTLITLLNLLDDNLISDSGVIKWSSPVPSFGDITCSWIATLGLNPSYREFLDEDGKELTGKLRRFHTLKSLGITSWSDIDARHIDLILESCRKYFHNNPFNRWFRALDLVISGLDASYYDNSYSACHLDLIPFATLKKWNELKNNQKSILLSLVGDTLGRLILESQIKVLILNGQTVVEIFQDISNVQLKKQNMENWSLPRYSTKNVKGIAYYGVIDALLDFQLDRKVLIIGFNHNLQSSFGVTTKVLEEIRKFITKTAMENTL